MSTASRRTTAIRTSPKGYNWESLRNKSGAELESHYVKLLDELGKKTGMLGDIFVKSQNKITDPAKLHKLIQLIDAENWVLLGADVKGDIYEGLLQKNAEDTKSGAGQYFTPRALIQAMVECVRPEPMKTIADPACGTGGFFLASYDYLNQHHKLNKEQLKFLKYETFRGWEIVASTARLCLMNLFLHNVGDMDHESPIIRDDSLRATPDKASTTCSPTRPSARRAAPPSPTTKGEEKREALSYNRQDFWATTSNKQLNFVQHIRSILKIGGSAAVVLPDNVLFEGGAGETVRKELMRSTELHTILRLPTGIFYAQGVKANVLFFENKPASKTTMDQGGVDLRLPHQRQAHPEDESAGLMTT
jgi:type I restriction enzyme M protein